MVYRESTVGGGLNSKSIPRRDSGYSTLLSFSLTLYILPIMLITK